MENQTLGNYLKTFRKRSGLSQRELGLVIGYVNAGQVGRHERSKTVPSLFAALSYQVIFRVAISELFSGLHAHVEQMMEENLAAFEAQLQDQTAKGRKLNETAQKLVWITQRKDL